MGIGGFFVPWTSDVLWIMLNKDGNESEGSDTQETVSLLNPSTPTHTLAPTPTLGLSLINSPDHEEVDEWHHSPAGSPHENPSSSGLGSTTSGRRLSTEKRPNIPTQSRHNHRYGKKAIRYKTKSWLTELRKDTERERKALTYFTFKTSQLPRIS